MVLGRLLSSVVSYGSVLRLPFVVINTVMKAVLMVWCQDAFLFLLSLLGLLCYFEGVVCKW